MVRKPTYSYSLLLVSLASGEDTASLLSRTDMMIHALKDDSDTLNHLNVEMNDDAPDVESPPDLRPKTESAISSMMSSKYATALSQDHNSSVTFDDVLIRRQALLDKMIAGSAEDNDGDVAFDFTPVFDSVVKDLHGTVKTQKELLIEANKAITVCNGHLQKARAEFLTSDEQQCQTKRLEHKDCRVKEADLVSQRNATCLARDVGMEKADNPPTCGCQVASLSVQAKINCVEEMKEWTASIPDLKDLDATCKNLEADLTLLSSSCNEKQVVFERDFCAYTKELHIVCTEQKECIGGAVHRRDHMSFAAKQTLEQSHHLFMTMEKIKCITSKIKQMKDATNASDIDLEGCSKMDFTIPDSLQFHIDDIVPVDDCDSSDAVANRPGGEEWTSLEYGEIDQSLLGESEACPPLPHAKGWVPPESGPGGWEPTVAHLDEESKTPCTYSPQERWEKVTNITDFQCTGGAAPFSMMTWVRAHSNAFLCPLAIGPMDRDDMTPGSTLSLCQTTGAGWLLHPAAVRSKEKAYFATSAGWPKKNGWQVGGLVWDGVHMKIYAGGELQGQFEPQEKIDIKCGRISLGNGMWKDDKEGWNGYCSGFTGQVKKFRFWDNIALEDNHMKYWMEQ